LENRHNIVYKISKDMQDTLIKKKLDFTNPENLPEYIQPFTHFFNKKNFEKLPE